MKRLFAAMVIIALSTINVCAMDHYYQIFRNNIVGLGQMIEGIDNVPAIGKLTALLPFAVLATSLKECPMQTMMVVTGVLCYLLSHNESVRAALSKYELINNFSWFQKRGVTTSLFDETLFVFDGEDDDDAEEENDVEDGMLFGEEFDEAKARQREQSRIIL